MRDRQLANGWPLEHSHSLTDQLAGQTEAGFQIIGLYEDHHSGIAISDYTPTYIATRALKTGSLVVCVIPPIYGGITGEKLRR